MDSRLPGTPSAPEPHSQAEDCAHAYARHTLTPMHTCTHPCPCACTPAHTRTHPCTCPHTASHAHSYSHTHSCLCACTVTHVHVPIYLCTCAHSQTHAHAHTRLFMQSHTAVHTLSHVHAHALCTPAHSRTPRAPYTLPRTGPSPWAAPLALGGGCRGASPAGGGRTVRRRAASTSIMPRSRLWQSGGMKCGMWNTPRFTFSSSCRRLSSSKGSAPCRPEGGHRGKEGGRWPGGVGRGEGRGQRWMGAGTGSHHQQGEQDHPAAPHVRLAAVILLPLQTQCGGRGRRAGACRRGARARVWESPRGLSKDTWTLRPPRGLGWEPPWTDRAWGGGRGQWPLTRITSGQA